MSLFNILVDIAARTASFEEGMKRAEDRLESFGEFAKKTLEFVGVGVGLREIVKQMDEIAEHGEKIANVAAQFNVTAESISQLEFVAKANNSTLQDLVGAMNNLSKGAGQATDGTGKLQRVLQDLRIDSDKFAKLSINDQLDLLADKFSKVPGPTQQTRIAIQLFGEEAGPKLVNVLKGGSSAIDELREKSDELGHTLSTLGAQDMKEARDDITELAAAFEGLKDKIVIGAVEVAKFFNIIKEPDKTRSLIKQFDDLAARRKDLVEQANNIDSSWISKFLLGKNYEQAKAQVQKELKAIEAQMNDVNNLLLQQEQAKNKPAETTPLAKPLQEFNITGARKAQVDQYQQLLDQLDDITKTSDEVQVASYHQKLVAIDELRKADVISELEADKRKADALDTLLPEFQVTAKTVIDTTYKQFSLLRDTLQNTAQGMYDVVYQEFLHPFESGLKGLVKSAAQVVQQILARFATIKFLQTIGGGLYKQGDNSFLSQLGGSILDTYGGKKATGGPLDPGKWYIAGEHGPEPVWGGGAGAFAQGYGQMAAAGASNVSISYNVDARGATTDLVQALPGILKQHGEQIKADVIDGIRRKKYPV